MSAPETGACLHCGAAVEECGSNFIHIATGKHVCSMPRDHGIHFAELVTDDIVQKARNEGYATGAEDTADELEPTDRDKALIRDAGELRAHLAPYLGCTADVSAWGPGSGRDPNRHPYAVYMDTHYPAEQYELAELVLMVYQLKPSVDPDHTHYYDAQSDGWIRCACGATPDERN